MPDLKDQGSDESYGDRTIHVPASGRVEDAPRPNSAEPAVAAEAIDGVARVDAELASKDTNPAEGVYEGVENPYISAETVEGAEHTDNAAAEPTDDDLGEKLADDAAADHADLEAPDEEDPFGDDDDDDTEEAEAEAEADAAEAKPKGKGKKPIV